MSPLYLREPSYWQCIASILQLYKISRSDRTKIECAKIVELGEPFGISWEAIFWYLRKGSSDLAQNINKWDWEAICHSVS
jgi:hypothetical protein